MFLKEGMNMKEFILWILLYGVYWYVSAILGNILYNITKIRHKVNKLVDEK